MADHSLQTILGVAPRRPIASPSTPALGDDQDYQAFSYGRVGSRAVAMICFIKSDGYQLALPYLELRSLSTSDPEHGFEIEFSLHRVIIEGRNLTIPFRYVRDNRLLELAEASRASAAILAENEPVVTKLVVRTPSEFLTRK